MKDIIINDKFRVDQKIGEGGFGLVYSGTDVQTGEELAIKLEHIRDGHEELRNEADIYYTLSGGKRRPEGIPRVQWFGQECDFYVMIHNLLGPSLEDLFSYCDRRFSLKTILLLADQLICRMRYIHSKSLIHRDIKPQNLLMGSGREGNVVYTIDFGLAKEINKDLTEQYEEDGDQRRRLGGTSRYTSLKNHQGYEQSWGDDMESLGYTLIYLARGSLPWQSLKATTEDELDEKIGQMKERMSAAELCAGLPAEFSWYIDYTRSLRFGQKPNYARLRRIFQRLFIRMKFRYDQVFDWTQKLFDELQERRPGARSTRSRARSNRGVIR